MEEQFSQSSPPLESPGRSGLCPGLHPGSTTGAAGAGAAAGRPAARRGGCRPVSPGAPVSPGRPSPQSSSGSVPYASGFCGTGTETRHTGDTVLDLGK